MPAADHLAELFAPVGGVTIKRMFGGLGVFKGGLMFALVADDVLYFKADDATAPRYDAEGSAPFIYRAKDRAVTMSYRQAPERLYDEPDEFAAWARAAFDAAVRMQKRPKSGRKAIRMPAAKKKPARK